MVPTTGGGQVTQNKREKENNRSTSRNKTHQRVSSGVTATILGLLAGDDECRSTHNEKSIKKANESASSSSIDSRLAKTRTTASNETKYQQHRQSSYLSSLVSKSSVLLSSLKQQYSPTNPSNSSIIQRPTTSGSAASATENQDKQTAGCGGVAMDLIASKPQQTAPAGRQQEEKQQQQATTTLTTPQQQQTVRRTDTLVSTSSSDKSQCDTATSSAGGQLASVQAAATPQSPLRPRPPLPPPPSREVVQRVTAALVSPPLRAAPDAQQLASQQQTPGRRDALAEQSLERDAAISLKVQEKQKHKRTSSIKNALRHAHLGPLRPSASKRAHKHKAAGESSPGGSSGGASKSGSAGELVKSQPYELFEPPVTQRTVQRSKRRGAMVSSDPRRQMSVDTIGLRQLTDEYLRNAGVTTISTSGQCSLVALNATQATSSAVTSNLLPGVPKTLASAATGGAGTKSLLSGGHSSGLESFPIETQLFQASRLGHAPSSGSHPGSDHHHTRKLVSASSLIGGCVSANPEDCNNYIGGAGSAGGDTTVTTTATSGANPNNCCYYNEDNDDYNNFRSSRDSFGSSGGNVTVLPGNLPWQTDVAIQCELLRPSTGARHNQSSSSSSHRRRDNDNDNQEQVHEDDENQPYETTGDILNTIAGPYRSNSNMPASGQQDASGIHLSATLRRGLSAISQHHLSPAGGLHVVGSLKKSLSNTFDMSLANARTAAVATAHQLHAQDSLPAYSSLQNEPDPARSDQQEVLVTGGAAGAAARQQYYRRYLTADGEASGGGGVQTNNNGNHLSDSGQNTAQGSSGGANELALVVANVTAALELADYTVGGQTTGLIGQIASKLGRQSSKKFTQGKKGLQRALSFDCRGYKRLEGSAAQSSASTTSGAKKQESNDSSNSFQLTAPGQLSKHKAHNKSTLGLHDNTAPRPYLPQSASQVDFQVPLLPYHKMHEAIVSQRLLEPPPPPAPPPSGSSSSTQLDSLVGGANSRNANRQPQPDVDELLCISNQVNDLSPEVACARSTSNQSHSSGSSSNCSLAAAAPPQVGQAGRQAKPRRSSDEPPHNQQRLALNIPTIATPAPDGNEQASAATSGSEQQRVARSASRRARRTTMSTRSIEDENDLESEEVCTIDEDDASKATVIVCLPSPNVTIELPSMFPPGAGQLTPQSAPSLSNSPSFCIDPDNRVQIINGEKNPTGGSDQQSGYSNQLTANDVFARSTNFIKRPSTLMTDDAMNQVAQALESSSSLNRKSGSLKKSPQSQQQQQQVRQNRRQAIVPPKLATDAGSNSDSENNQLDDPPVGQLIDVDESDAGDNHAAAATPSPTTTKVRVYAQDDIDYQALKDCATTPEYRVVGRKRSGGSGSAQQTPANNGDGDRSLNRLSGGAGHLSGSQNLLPTFYIESDHQTSEGVSSNAMSPAAVQRQQADYCDKTKGQQQPRPDSQMTNAESIVSSGSSTNLSMKRESAAVSPGGLSVPFGTTTRRRSSIAVIPQMQICPGDLLVYSKQLIDRMNQPEETENQPPPFLTVDDKKGKNIWSSFKLCAQFDTRTIKARNELLCSLEDVLASLQPSTFVDEQLSHYKGMLWNEFLYETESRRSASSEGLAACNAEEDQPNGLGKNIQQQQQQQQADSNLVIGRSSSIKGSLQAINQHESIKLTMSSGAVAQQDPANSADNRSSVASALSKSPRHNLSSRFKEKPKLKRGQTVDSVFRIPLIPSSPLKHAQQHQQTPTAHLEEHDLNEDDERLSPGAASGPSTPAESPHANRRKRSSSTRSRSGSSNQAQHQQQPVATANINLDPEVSGKQDSSFETDDAADLVAGTKETYGAKPKNRNLAGNHSNRTPNQIVRQSSLSTISSTITRTEQKRQRALWDLFQSECAFFFDHLMTLKNVYMEPLKKIQVEGFAMFADPDVLFGNLDELCCGVYDFCKEFLHIIMRTLKTRPEELNATDVLIKLYKKNPKIDHLRGVYHRYTLNYINALTYLESLRRQVEFVEFERWSSRDVRCKKLQLTDLLVAPVQHIMRVPIILKDIESHTENVRDRDEIRAILAVEEASLRELDDKMRWLKNFERLLEIQKNISWPNVFEMDAKLYIPEFLKEVLSKQPCEKLIVSPRRQIVHEGTLSNYDLGKACDMHVILFDDMLLLTRRKKGLTKRTSTVCKTNSGGPTVKDDGSFKYIVYKQPLSLDRFYVHDIQQIDSQTIGIKHLFMLIVMNRFQQITSVHSFSAPNDDVKQTWLFKIKKTADRWKRNQFSSSGSGEQQQQQAHHSQSAGANTQQVARQHRPAGVQQSVPTIETTPITMQVSSRSGHMHHHHQQQLMQNQLVKPIIQTSSLDETTK